MFISRIRQILFATSLGLLAQAGLAADGDSDEARLRTSDTLTMRKALDESQRALLRLESRVGQSIIDDRALISDLFSRIERMAGTIKDLHKILGAMPVGAPCKPAAPCPAAPAAAAPADGGLPAGLGDLPWLQIAGGAGILALLALWFRQRRRGTDTGDDLGTPTLTPAQPIRPASPPAAEPVAAKPALPKPAKAAPAVPVAPHTPPAAAKPAVAEVPRTPEASATPRPAAAQPSIHYTPPPMQAATAPAEAKGEGDMSLELADVMLSMGLTEGAVQTLSDHISQNPRQALFHWLKLLDIYRKSGMKVDFDKASAEIQQHFNMAPPDWREDSLGQETKVQSLEDYAHISSRMQELWPRRSCAEYLNRLLEDNRGGTRTGFPQPVIEEILLLLSMLKD